MAVCHSGSPWATDVSTFDDIHPHPPTSLSSIFSRTSLLRSPVSHVSPAYPVHATRAWTLQIRISTSPDDGPAIASIRDHGLDTPASKRAYLNELPDHGSSGNHSVQ